LASPWTGKSAGNYKANGEYIKDAGLEKRV
jgi:hypothetical protein